MDEFGKRRQWVRRAGRDSWMALGIIALVVVVFYALGALSSIVMPLLVALILATVLQPFVRFLEKHGAGPNLAATVALLVALVAAIGMVYLVIWGFIRQLPEIYLQIDRGWAALMRWVHSLDLDPAWLEWVREQVQVFGPKLGSGAFGLATSAFSSVVAMFVGTFFALFFLYYALRDGRKFGAWFAGVLSLDRDLVVEITGVTGRAVQGYFKGTAITALITAPILIIPLMILRVPLVGPIFVLYFFLSFIPYIGAFMTGIFAVLIAFSSGGLAAALVILAALLISNGAIQNVVLAWALGSSLQIHGVTVLLSTLVGGAVWGMLGMVLGPPLAAAIVKSSRVIRRYYDEHPRPKKQRKKSLAVAEQAELGVKPIGGSQDIG